MNHIYELARENLSIEQLKAIISEKEGKQVKKKRIDPVSTIPEMKMMLLASGLFGD
jgi:hypothetical protein